jgi:nicotinamidase-related amidase
MSHPTKMSSADTALLVIDMQEKLLAKVPSADALVNNVAFLVDSARVVHLPVFATEQYPKGLGPTTKPLAERLPERPAKTAFSCCAVPEVAEGLQHGGRPKVVLAGIETHVCVLGTALDLLGAGYQVYVPVDAVASRYPVDHEFALRRLERAGAILTTSETCAFEWVGGSDHPLFKKVSALVQERMKNMV